MLTVVSTGGCGTAARFKGSLGLRRVFSAVVNARDPALVPAGMVQRRLDDVRLGNIMLGHAGCHCAAQIVELPRLADAILEAGLLYLPRPKAD